MARIKIIINLFVVFFAIATVVKAQDSTTYNGMNWYLKKSVAIKEAKAQKKNIFLLWGRETCPDCQWVKRKLSEAPLKDIIDKNYVLWFSNSLEYRFDSEELIDYLFVLNDMSLRYIPHLSIIDFQDVKVTLGFMFGPDFSLNNEVINSYKIAQYYKEMSALINNHVDNDIIYSGKNSDVSVFVADNNIIIKSKPIVETVSVYTLTGSLVDRFHKTEYEITRDLSKYPKGLLIVAGSSGWSQKIVL
jgi:hypothetical protein